MYYITTLIDALMCTFADSCTDYCIQDKCKDYCTLL